MKKLSLIAGPCAIESEELLYEVATALKPLAQHPEIDFYFKSSFDKANRTSIHSYRGPGLEKGLSALLKIKQDFSYKIITDFHENAQAAVVAEVADMIQIPAFLCRQTDLLVAAAKTKAAINIKKGQFLAPKDMFYSVLKILEIRDPKAAAQAAKAQSIKALAAAHNIYLTERGSSFGYGNLVVDMRSLLIMRDFAPVIFDATHSVQMPGAAQGSSGGESRFAAPLARAAAAVGVDGFFFETHPKPKKALCDGPNMLSLDELKRLVPELLELIYIKERYENN